MEVVMTDSIQPTGVALTESAVEYATTNKEIRDYVKKQFNNRISMSNASTLIKQLLIKGQVIPVRGLLSKTFLRDNKSKLTDDEEYLKPNFALELRTEIIVILQEYEKDIEQYSESEHNLIVKNVDGEDCYVVTKHTTFEKLRELICKEFGNVLFKYSFEHPDLELEAPKASPSLQRCQMAILQEGVKFDYPVINYYKCPDCGSEHRRMEYEDIGKSGKFKCIGQKTKLNNKGEEEVVTCNALLAPDELLSTSRKAYFFEVTYTDRNDTTQKTNMARGISFTLYKPGMYECVLCKLNNPLKLEMFLILDVKEILTKEFVFPKKEDGRNYLLTLIDSFDSYLEKQVGVRIQGLYPLKIAMLLQAAAQFLGFERNMNIQIMGAPGTGKTLILSTWGLMFYGVLSQQSNGTSISIAALRGSSENIQLFDKAIKITTVGHFGQYRAIYIDEISENEELLNFIKSFALEPQYGSDKVGSTGVKKERTAHINVSGNINTAHTSLYRGEIRKAYNDDSFVITNEIKVRWDESWDLHKPLEEYGGNPYLQKVIKDKREKMTQNETYWIDGLQVAVHERFPFYFFLVNDKENLDLDNISALNEARKKVLNSNELINYIWISKLEEFFKERAKYKNTDVKVLFEENKKINIIVKQYGMKSHSRQMQIYYYIVRFSKIINERGVATEEDYDVLRYILENIERKIDVADTNVYTIRGPSNIDKLQQTLDMLDDTTTTGQQFGIQTGLDGDFQ